MTSKKRVLIIGSGPLPNDKEGIREAAGLRTEQFFSSIAKEGHHVSLFCLHNKNPQIANTDNIWRSSRTSKTLFRQIRECIKKCNPEIIIGVNTFPSLVASKICPDHIPFWADLNGWIMAEAHARSWSETTNLHFANAWRQEKAIIKRADMISTVSEAQKFCVIGEIASIGQFRHDNFLENRVIAIKNCTKWFDTDQCLNCQNVERSKDKNFDMSSDLSFSDKSRQKTENMFNEKSQVTQETPMTKEEEINEKMLLKSQKRTKEDKFDNQDNFKKTENMFRGKTVPEHAFVIAWIGGYNNWVDEQTLFEGIEKAMQQNENIFFVSTGGAIPKVANDTFGRFKNKIEQSPFKNRFIFLGWINTEDMPKVYAESDMGINIDLDCTETHSGARNRINEMMKFGLPVVTSGGSEVGKEVGDYNAGISIGYTNARQELTESIVKMSNMSKEERSQMGQNGQKYVFDLFAEEKVMQPVLQFITNPKIRNKKTLAIEGLFLFAQNAWWYLKTNGIGLFWGKVMQKLGR